MNAIAIVKYGFAAAGLVMLAGTVYWSQQVRAFIARASVAQGTVIDLVSSRSSNSTTYRPAVRFTAADGRAIEFVSSTGSSPPAYSRGESVEVLYSPSAPEDATINGFFSLWLGPLILGGLGGTFFLIGGLLLAIPRLRSRREEHLKSHGMPIVTKFQGVEVNRSIHVNGSHPFRIVTQWQNPATGALHVFKSADLWFDPTDHIAVSDITVFIEQDNPKRYVVDLSFLPKLAS